MWGEYACAQDNVLHPLLHLAARNEEGRATRRATRDWEACCALGLFLLLARQKKRGLGWGDSWLLWVLVGVWEHSWMRENLEQSHSRF